MFNFEDFSRHLLRLWVLALLGLALAARHSHGKSCSAPPDVLNGQWIGESLLVGATMTLKCNTGYTVGGKYPLCSASLVAGMGKDLCVRL
ncbi:hypothetical protein ANANG_G00222180 [Anguilla anguilla]|uniref:Sushi domain-containing protein n=1 Tax=Anguilla anguilla TaxID=7936 RepID=A0A9D3RSS3_ANGAN|nr:hypothetical protein ANANG_G00222180 [Anguilla anguilla]